MKDDIEALNDLDEPVAGLLGALFVTLLRLGQAKGSWKRAAELTGLSVRTLLRYAKGEVTPPPKTLALLAHKVGVERPLLDRLQGALGAHRLARAAGMAADSATSHSLAAEVVAAAQHAVVEADALLAVELAPEPWEETGRPRPEDRARAAELWRRCLGLDRDQRYRLIRESSAFRLWSFAERLVQESEAATADSPADALDLAQLALEVARGVRGTPSWRARVEADALTYVGNASRVGNELGQARAAFAQARKLQAAFSPNDPPLLDESRLPDREASFCREERRFPEALALHEEALALAPPAAAGRILLNRAATPIDAALAGLDLALYWLERGDTAAVKKLAAPLERIFTAQGIRREALSALRLFCEAAQRERATVELARKVSTEIEKVQRQGSPRPAG